MSTVEELDELRTVARRVFAAHGDDPGALAEALGSLGWPALGVPSAAGGLGAGAGASSIVLAEAGAHGAPGTPASTLLCALALAAGGRPEHDPWLETLVAGERRGALVLSGPGGRLGVPGLIDPSGPGLAVDGVGGFVADAEGADVLVVAVARDGRTELVVVEGDEPGVVVVDQPVWDPTRRFATVTLCRAPIIAPPLVGGPALVEHLVSLAAWTLACDSTGLAERCLTQLVAYGSERHQFGRPIGSFQAWKHRCADLYIAVAEAQMAVRRVNAVLDAGALGDPVRDPVGLALAASTAKFVAGDNALAVAESAVQLHGAIAYTAEFGLHRLLKRAALSRVLLGTSEDHADRAAAALLSGP